MIKLKLRGAEQIHAKFYALDTKLQRVGLIKSLKVAGELMKSEVERRAPVDRGDLKRSIVTKFVKRGARRAAIQVGPDSKHAWYGKFAEFGTAKQRRDPFMQPALEAVEKQVIQSTGEALWNFVAENT